MPSFRHAFFACSLFLCTSSLATPQTNSINKDLQITKIQNGALVATHAFPWAANSLAVDCGNGQFVLVDTPYHNQATRDLVEWLRRQYGEIKLTAINTHFHNDNLGGNGYLQSQKVPVFGSEKTATLLAERGEAVRRMSLTWLGKPKHHRFFVVFKQQKFIAPDHTFNISDGLQLSIGATIVHVYFPGPAHSPDNVAVYFPRRKILFGGCMVRSLAGKSLGNLSDAEVSEWPQSMRKLKQRFPQTKLVIPGHGAWGGSELLDHTIHLAEQAAASGN